MKVSVITNDNICAVNELVLSAAAKTAAPTKPNMSLPMVLVLVPDRFTLQAEKILLQNHKSLLNTRVLTFSMLYNLVHEEIMGFEKSLENRVLDKTTAVLFMWRAIRTVRDRLQYFASSVDQYAFAEKMFNTINQLSSCNTDFTTLERNAATDVTHRKMHDISEMYGEYRQLTGEFTDGSRMLAWLIENLHASKIIKNANMFVTGFEHLSVQRAEVIRQLMYISGTFAAGVRTQSEIEGFINEVRFAM